MSLDFSEPVMIGWPVQSFLVDEKSAGLTDSFPQFMYPVVSLTVLNQLSTVQSSLMVSSVLSVFFVLCGEFVDLLSISCICSTRISSWSPDWFNSFLLDFFNSAGLSFLSVLSGSYSVQAEAVSVAVFISAMTAFFSNVTGPLSYLAAPQPQLCPLLPQPQQL